MSAAIREAVKGLTMEETIEAHTVICQWAMAWINETGVKQNPTKREKNASLLLELVAETGGVI